MPQLFYPLVFSLLRKSWCIYITTHHPVIIIFFKSLLAFYHDHKGWFWLGHLTSKHSPEQVTVHLFLWEVVCVCVSHNLSSVRLLLRNLYICWGGKLSLCLYSHLCCQSCTRRLFCCVQTLPHLAGWPPSGEASLVCEVRLSHKTSNLGCFCWNAKTLGRYKFLHLVLPSLPWARPRLLCTNELSLDTHAM